MIIVACVDDRYGMLFNGRRQSQDRAQREDLLLWCGDRKLKMNRYSAALFPEACVETDDAFLESASSGDICFVENGSLAAIEERIEEVLLYRWNRIYPADFRLDLNFDRFQLVERVEFKGTSHEIITRERYRIE